jgi:Inner membrane component of T3SS, cytoplasmic domain
MILLESRGVKFRVQYPNASAHEVELEGTVAILGRDPSCDLVLNDVKCSRRHAVVEAGPQGLAIRDSGSANGVFLNGKKVDRAQLNDGDVFRLGDVTLTVLPEDMPGTLVMGPDELPAAAPPKPAPRPPAPPPLSPAATRPGTAAAQRNTETVPPHLRPVTTPPRARPEAHRPLTLTVLAILWMISVALYPLAGLGAAQGRSGVQAALSIVLGLALAVVSAGMAFGLWTRRSWARGVQIAVASVGLLLCPFTLASAAVLVYMFRPSTAAYFSGGEPLADTPPDAAELTFTGIIVATVLLGTIVSMGASLFLRASTSTLPPR